MEKNDKTPQANADKATGRSSSPKTVKRTALEPVMYLQSTSTPHHTSRNSKRMLLECDATPVEPMATPNGSMRSTTTSTTTVRSRSFSDIRITRGVQTIAPKTANRYCQVSVVRIRKPSQSASVQTDQSARTDNNPPASVEIGCQTKAPVALYKDACVETDHQVAIVRQENVGCQTDDVTNNETMYSSHVAKEGESTIDSFTTMLNEVARQFGIELQPDKDVNEDGKAKKKTKKKECEDKQQKEAKYLQQCLVNKTYKAITAKLDQKIGAILEQHLAEYGHQTVASQQQLVQWTKRMLRRQQNIHTAAAAKQVPTRKIVLVRKMAPPQQPPKEERGVQCDKESMATGGVSVATQWERQRPAVTNRQKKAPAKAVASKKPPPNKSTTSIDSKPCSAGAGVAVRCSLRQTKLPRYAKEQNGTTDQPLAEKCKLRPRKQQGECAPKSANHLDAVVASSKPSFNTAPPSTSKRRKSGTRSKTPLPQIHVAETPSPPSSPLAKTGEKKYFPYRSPPRYPSQCSKSTETTFLTPTRMRICSQEDQPLFGTRTQNQSTSTDHGNAKNVNPTMLLSPFSRMYVESCQQQVTTNALFMPARSEIGSVSPTPPPVASLRKMPSGTDLSDRRLSAHTSCPDVIGLGLVRENPPNMGIISSQQLYSQIGQAVEKALKNRTMPSLTTMYGAPTTMTFNAFHGYDSELESVTSDGSSLDANQKEAPGRHGNGRVIYRVDAEQPKQMHRFVCSSAQDGQALQQKQPPPFRNERSPSLSPIVYRDNDSEDEIL